MNSPMLSPKRLLLIDDNKVVLMAHCSMLSQAGYTVETASSGQEALKKFTTSQNYDLILTDYHMPEMTGLELAQKVLNSAENKKSLIVIAITSEFSPEIEKRCKASGVKAVIPKPLEMKNFVNAVSSQN